MTRKDHRIVFMGTPEFAKVSLSKIVDAGYKVVGVVTAPDKPAGRGRKLQVSEVKEFATEKFPVLQPPRLKDPSFIEDLKSWKADLFVVVAFRMLPQVVWDMPPKGTVNLHASLLPDYRGAAPINRAIINGERVTGITTFFIDKNIDTGNILLNKKIQIPFSMDAGSLHDILKEEGATLLVKTLDQIFSGNALPVPQDKIVKLHKAPKINPEDCMIPWNSRKLVIYNHIRGLSPYPGAWTIVINEKSEKIRLKIFRVSISDRVLNHPVGTLFTDGKSYVQIALKDGILSILELQVPGKSRMNIKDFLAGNNPESWKIVTS